jgi:hypothetical protein
MKLVTLSAVEGSKDMYSIIKRRIGIRLVEVVGNLRI